MTRPLAAAPPRDGGSDGRIRRVGAEEHQLYDRPPLSKQVLLGTARATA